MVSVEVEREEVAGRYLTFGDERRGAENGGPTHGVSVYRQTKAGVTSAWTARRGFKRAGRTRYLNTGGLPVSGGRPSNPLLCIRYHAGSQAQGCIPVWQNGDGRGYAGHQYRRRRLLSGNDCISRCSACGSWRVWASGG